MARTCTICSHPNRDEIDKAIISGASLRDIARQYATSKDAIKRHADSGHIAKKIQKAKEAKEIKSGLTMIGKLEELERQAGEAFDIAKGQNNPRGMCAAIQAKKGIVELAGKVTGEYLEKRGLVGNDGSDLVINLTTASFRKPADDSNP